LSSTNKSLFAVDKYGLIIVLLYFPIAVVFAIPTFNSEPVVGYLARINLILGISAALFLTKYVAKNKNLKSLFIWLGSASFFVYATHEPLLIILRKVVCKAINPDSSFLVLTLYFLLPIVVITFSLVAYHFLCRVLPRFTSIVTGGRSQQLSSETYNVSVPSGLHLR
jgi:fucose 4-O-acetylase-like acetyltransferase